MDVTRLIGVKEMAEADRPRERLLKHGASVLSTAELIAVLLNTGTVGVPVTTVAERLLADNGGLRGLMRMDVSQLVDAQGVGPAKAAKLAAALELAARVVALGPDDRPRISTPEDIVRLVGTEMGSLDHEQLRVLVVDTKHRVMAVRTVYKGTANQAQVRIAEVFRDAVKLNGTGIAVVHNHPSGDATPSAADLALTVEIEHAGTLLGISVLDHVIVVASGHQSLRRLGIGFSRS
ncbi:DNA repair protein RadC [soil metagenome]